MRPPVELINRWILEGPFGGPVEGWIGPVLAAPFVGSFLGVLIARLPAGRPVAVARSACDACGRALGPAEMVPVASFLAQRGRCRGCGARIGMFHLQVELAALAVAVWAASAASGALLWASCALGWSLLVLGWIDAGSLLLPDVLTLPLVVGGLVEAWALEPEALLDRGVGAVAGYLAFRLIALGYRRARGREGLGAGDAKLLAAGGAWVGAAALGSAVLAAAVLGLAWAGVLWLRGRPAGGTTRIPFGPCLALGIWLAWLYSP